MEKITTKKSTINKNKEIKINNNLEDNLLPRKEVINNILNYSKALKISKSKGDNSYETVLN
jgi:hypothetical protein